MPAGRFDVNAALTRNRVCRSVLSLEDDMLREPCSADETIESPLERHGCAVQFHKVAGKRGGAKRETFRGGGGPIGLLTLCIQMR
jgi:hypothetical protein